MSDLKNSSLDQNSFMMKFNITIVDFQIRNNGVYHSGSTEIKNNFSDLDSSDLNEFYSGKICSGDKLLYMGTLSKELIRNGYGINFYNSSDIYLGYWINDKRNDTGIYIYRSKEEKINEIFYGKWILGKKNGFGVYFWKNGNYPPLMDIFIGEFKDDKISDGLHVSGISTKGLPKNFYYGKFNQDGQKEDENAISYSPQSDIVYLGKMTKGEFIEGTIYKYDKNSQSLYNIIKNDNEDEYLPVSNEVSEIIKKKIKNFHSKFNDLDEGRIFNLAKTLISEIAENIINIKSVIDLKEIDLKENKYLDYCEKIIEEISGNTTGKKSKQSSEETKKLEAGKNVNKKKITF
jgi:hypothetical protein